VAVNGRGALTAGVFIVALVLEGCGSGGTHQASTTTSPAGATPSSVATPSVSVPTTGAATGGGPTCPTLAQAKAALGASYSGPTSTAGPGGSIICEYTGSAGNAGVTIFAHQSEAVFTGQVANAGRAPGMQKVSGVGDGAFALTAGGRTVVNAWANGSRTVVAAQGPGSLAQTEALARVALSDN
jgi:hypothetical protein